MIAPVPLKQPWKIWFMLTDTEGDIDLKSLYTLSSEI